MHINLAPCSWIVYFLHRLFGINPSVIVIEEEVVYIWLELLLDIICSSFALEKGDKFFAVNKILDPIVRKLNLIVATSNCLAQGAITDITL